MLSSYKAGMRPRTNLVAGIFVATATIIATIPSESSACACGCGIFDVGTDVMLPTQPGGRLYFNYSMLNQDSNHHGTSSAPEADNEDKAVKTRFYTAGLQYMFNREWGAQIDVPVWQRTMFMDDGMGMVMASDNSSIGDIKLKAIYSGFSADMSSGITFGLKLPTGDDNYAGFEREAQIGTGSTDALLGAYHIGNLAKNWTWFANINFNLPVDTKNHFRPGAETNAATGVYYRGWQAGEVRISPMLQLSGTYKRHNSGAEATPSDTGYELVVVSPGLELSFKDVKLDASYGVPAYNNVNGNQLVASEYFKIGMSYNF